MLLISFFIFSHFPDQEYDRKERLILGVKKRLLLLLQG
ncbi:hypothetical protein FTV88_2911 [Heliorestis convoluta]|uniref:Uncharacterized protein n=1 Tax=Heliorestis convoluta TaxID=356322 RepID=A0A5Q2N9P9_9FIRM|nr:hypothetical protein FTV88_2911 [Heliorestis convoluta]